MYWTLSSGDQSRGVMKTGRQEGAAAFATRCSARRQVPGFILLSLATRGALLICVQTVCASAEVLQMSEAVAELQPQLDTRASVTKCPKWLNWACSAACLASHCSGELLTCMEDTVCRQSLMSVNSCMGSGNRSNPNFPDDCLTPDNAKRDAFLFCAIEQHRCMSAGNASIQPHYPKCRENGPDLAGDSAFHMDHLYGKWYKVYSWKLGEPVECMSCQSAVMRSTLDSQGHTSEGAIDFVSYWDSPDRLGKLWKMNASAVLTHRNFSSGPKLFNSGRMFGLTFWENYTVVRDASHEAVDPYVLFYVCGGTLNGNYTTAFAIAREPVLGSSGRMRLSKDVAAIGMNWTNDFCTVNNTCYSKNHLKV